MKNLGIVSLILVALFGSRQSQARNFDYSLQKYTFTFKLDGTNLTGRAFGIRDNATNDVAITEGAISTNGISFVEPLKIQDNDIRIEYTGKVSGDELKLHRKVGDFAEYDIVAKRVSATNAGTEAQPATTMGTNSPPAKP